MKCLMLAFYYYKHELEAAFFFSPWWDIQAGTVWGLGGETDTGHFPAQVLGPFTRVCAREPAPDSGLTPVLAFFTAGSTSSSLCEHWVSRLPGSKQASVTSAASSRRTSLASLSESVEMTGERSEDDGGYGCHDRFPKWHLMGTAQCASCLGARPQEDYWRRWKGCVAV